MIVSGLFSFLFSFLRLWLFVFLLFLPLSASSSSTTQLSSVRSSSSCPRASSSPSSVSLCSSHGRCLEYYSYSVFTANSSVVPRSHSSLSSFCDCDSGWNSHSDFIPGDGCHIHEPSFIALWILVVLLFSLLSFFACAKIVSASKFLLAVNSIAIAPAPDAAAVLSKSWNSENEILTNNHQPPASPKSGAVDRPSEGHQRQRTFGSIAAAPRPASPRNAAQHDIPAAADQPITMLPMAVPECDPAAEADSAVNPIRPKNLKPLIMGDSNSTNQRPVPVPSTIDGPPGASDAVSALIASPRRRSSVVGLSAEALMRRRSSINPAFYNEFKPPAALTTRQKLLALFGQPVVRLSLLALFSCCLVLPLSLLHLLTSERNLISVAPTVLYSLSSFAFHVYLHHFVYTWVKLNIRMAVLSNNSLQQSKSLLHRMHLQLDITLAVTSIVHILTIAMACTPADQTIRHDLLSLYFSFYALILVLFGTVFLISGRNMIKVLSLDLQPALNTANTATGTATSTATGSESSRFCWSFEASDEYSSSRHSQSSEGDSPRYAIVAGLDLVFFDSHVLALVSILHFISLDSRLFHSRSDDDRIAKHFPQSERDRRRLHSIAECESTYCWRCHWQSSGSNVLVL
jgi:hypothetical protein